MDDGVDFAICEDDGAHVQIWTNLAASMAESWQGYKMYKMEELYYRSLKKEIVLWRCYD